MIWLAEDSLNLEEMYHNWGDGCLWEDGLARDAETVLCSETFIDIYLDWTWFTEVALPCYLWSSESGLAWGMPWMVSSHQEVVAAFCNLLYGGGE